MPSSAATSRGEHDKWQLLTWCQHLPMSLDVHGLTSVLAHKWTGELQLSLIRGENWLNSHDHTPEPVLGNKSKNSHDSGVTLTGTTFFRGKKKEPHSNQERRMQRNLVLAIVGNNNSWNRSPKGSKWFRGTLTDHWTCNLDICQEFVHMTSGWEFTMNPQIPCIMQPRNAIFPSLFQISFCLYIEIQITLITTSRPLFSPPSYLKLHMPSVFSFQYAPVALCMPLLPTWGFPSVPVASFFRSLVASPFSDFIELSWFALARFKAEVGTRCWMMVLLTAYLYDGVPPEGDDSDISDFRMEFYQE